MISAEFGQTLGEVIGDAVEALVWFFQHAMTNLRAAENRIRAAFRALVEERKLRGIHE